jgi:hypothetical protein
VRKIFVQEPDSDIWKKWIRDCQEETQKAIDSVAKGEKPIVNEKLYKRESIKKSYFVSKGAPFYGRCAYCESPIKDNQYPQVEHFRPKAGIKDENGKVINFKDENGNDTGEPHLGYYWLAYDWCNLLVSCQVCNNLKSTIFPVVGQHAQSPNDEVNEKPLLINPISDLEEDNPENHLTVKDGTIYEVNESIRGRMCIETFKLNGRDGILESRVEKAEFIAFKILDFRRIYAEIPNNPDDKSRREIYTAIIKELDYFIDIFKGKEAYTAASVSKLKEMRYSIEAFQKLRKEIEASLSELDG